MNTDEIKKLIEKYYEAETTAEEEAQLAELLKQGDTGSKISQADRDLLSFIDSERNIKMKAPIASIPSETSTPKEKLKIKWLVYQVAAVAASILLLIGIFKKSGSNHEYLLPNTYNDPVLAYQETTKALYTVSYKLNSSLEKLNELQKIDKAFQSLNELQKLEKYSDMLIKLQKVGNEKI
jgi:hypothetical protein